MIVGGLLWLKMSTRLVQSSPSMWGNGIINVSFAPIDLRPRIWAFQTTVHLMGPGPFDEIFRAKSFSFNFFLSRICYPSHPITKHGPGGKRQISSRRKFGKQISKPQLQTQNLYAKRKHVPFCMGVLLLKGSSNTPMGAIPIQNIFIGFLDCCWPNKNS